MKANELRIGNYVNVPNSKQCPFRIDAFEHCSEKFIKVAQEVKLNGFEVHPLTWYGGDLEPIPLTEEWLVKFGFETNDVRYWQISSFRLHINRYGEWIFKVETFEQEIKYVHQLQNLYFALIGEELTIKSKDDEKK
jgi:hypothetical protein